MKFNKHNFFRNTFAVFKQKTPPKDAKVHYKSKYNSRYVFTDEGVYRHSNHWGRVGTCRWRLVCENHIQQNNYWGYARWEDFMEYSDTKALFYIEKKDGHYFIQHKAQCNHPLQTFRTAKETAKIIKKLKELEQSQLVQKYIAEAYADKFQQDLIEELIATNATFQQVWRKLIATYNN